MNVTVLGAGAWGTAIAVHAAATHATRLWVRDAEQAARMAEARCNARYLPDVPLPPALVMSDDFEASIGHAQAGLLIVATPMAGLAEMLCRLPEGFDAPLVWLCKGFEAGTARLGHEIARDAAPKARTGVVSGPSFAIEVARGQPTAIVAASSEPTVRATVVAALHGESLRIYTSADPIGVEVGGAVKNVLAIATGIADGLRLGLNARAALVTRGLAEMTRLGVALGAEASTFMGLSGLGDLVLTATGELSRNRAVGLRLACGESLARIVADAAHVAEGVRSAAMVLRRADALRVEMPIVAAVVAVLEGRLDPQAAVDRLMRRGARHEALPEARGDQADPA